ncbi:hypothetical protein [Tiger frog virus]|uniref:Surface protein n=1 Tax=Rana tigrina ranavirus TaxID=160691 RepID=A0A6M8PTY0_RTRV|nr:hypothetical protein [Tiger frog virus]QKG82764.1 hypothetical protein [Tiger frog virus]
MACYSPRCDSPYPYADWDDCESVSSLGSVGGDYDRDEEDSFQDPLAVGDEDVFEEPERVHIPIVDICKVARMSEEEERMAIVTRKAKEVAKELSETMSGKLRWLSDSACDKPGPKRRKKKRLSMVDYPTLGSEAPAGSRIKMSKIGKDCTLVMASGGTRVEGSHPLVREFNGEKPPKNVGRKYGPAWFGYLSAKNATDKKTGGKQSDKEVEDDWTFVSKNGKGIQPEDAKPQGVKHQHAIRRDDRHRHGMRGTRYGAPNYGYRDQQQQRPAQGQQSRGQWQRRPREGEGQWTQRRPAQQQRPDQQQQRPDQQPPQKPLRKRKPPPTNQRIVKPQKPKTPEPQPPQQDWFDSV